MVISLIIFKKKIIIGIENKYFFELINNLKLDYYYLLIFIINLTFQDTSNSCYNFAQSFIALLIDTF